MKKAAKRTSNEHNKPDHIIIIRHAQKPVKNSKLNGIRENGKQDPESLTVRGWQHAGALASIFSLKHNENKTLSIPNPDVIYASGVGKKKVNVGGEKKIVGSKSTRPIQTISLLAEKLKLKPITSFSKGEEVELVKDVFKQKGTVLICWQHQNIAVIGNQIAGDDKTVPQSWAQDNYDLVYVFNRTAKGYSFEQFFHGGLLPS